ncbi:MAG TPA: ATP-dependent DNA helicase RecG, partial [Legionella sp.]|nr:ATP-dependent DNA helicase RecG [Legionella sp.]
RANDWCVVGGRICVSEVKQGGKRPMLYCQVEDKTGLFTLRFFNFHPKQVKLFHQNQRIRVFGEVREFAKKYEMIHPEYQLLDRNGECPVEETLTPIYATTHGLSQTRLRQLIKRAITHCQAALGSLEWMTPHQLQQHGFQSMPLAVAQLHLPPPDTPVESLEEGSHPALKRLAFDELLAQRLSMEFARLQRNTLAAPLLPKSHGLLGPFLAMLPFALTPAQQRVHDEITADLMLEKPMLRLVQGDVGSGKTVIAALAAAQAIANGYQVALMAPTDILSEQHTQTLFRWFTPLGISVKRLSGKMNARARRETLIALATHECQLIIGTHALFQESVVFARLGLVIIDEQHRFGVEQRLSLQQKGQKNSCIPHQLLMTATPIPRTLAMTQFGHMDVSSIDELPPGRTPITTAVVNQDKRESIISRLQAAIATGRQAYWVCTLIDESEALQCAAATESAERLQTLLPNIRVGLVHGRMTPLEKEAIMAAFKAGEIHVLVATTVIEVGVDVANASLMIIENAERLGLSQLHQLRGRVGRGSAQSHCLLLYQSPLSRQGNERLRIMRSTSDGFLIAEKDLQLRGAGEFLGTRQTGYREYKVAHLPRDEGLLQGVVTAAIQLSRNEPAIAHAIAKRWLGEFEPFLQG